jgi:hypothetical protein
LVFDSLKNLEFLLNLQTVPLTDKYPTLLTLDLKLRNIRRSDQFKHQCNFDDMKLNVAFTNDLANNISKLTSFNSNYAGQQKMLQNLHIEIDNELGINHQEDGQ